MIRASANTKSAGQGLSQAATDALMQCQEAGPEALMRRLALRRLPTKPVVPGEKKAALRHTLRSRLARREDAAACSDMLVLHLPVGCHQAKELPALLGKHLANEQLKILKIEARSERCTSWTLIALGISGFVASPTAASELAEPAPFLMARLLSQAISGVPVFLGLSEIGRSNAGRGLDLVVEYMQNSWDLGDPLWREAAAIAHDAYTRHHRGYRLNRALQEGWAPHAQVYLDAGYQVHRSFDIAALDLDSIQATFGSQRALFYADKAAVEQRAPGLPTTYAFQYAPPRCRFTLAEQQILRLGSDGLTDSEIACELETSLNAIKLAWRSIYHRVQTNVTHLLDDGFTGGVAGRRGPEKRRRVLNFVREQPQEVRPYING